MSTVPTQTDEHSDVSGRTSLPSLIAWLSVCLLAAGWGPRLDPFLRNVWASFGLLGLASAIGLDVLQRTRQKFRRRAQRRLIQRRVERELSRIAVNGVNLRMVRHILRRLASEDRGSRDHYSEKRNERRLPFQRPVRIRLLSDAGSEWDEATEPDVSGWIRDLSPSGVGLAHEKPIRKGRVALILELDKGESISLIVHLGWCRRQSNGIYFSGGRLVEVVTEIEDQDRHPVAAHAG